MCDLFKMVEKLDRMGFSFFIQRDGQYLRYAYMENKDFIGAVFGQVGSQQAQCELVYRKEIFLKDEYADNDENMEEWEKINNLPDGFANDLTSFIYDLGEIKDGGQVKLHQEVLNHFGRNKVLSFGKVNPISFGNTIFENDPANKKSELFHITKLNTYDQNTVIRKHMKDWDDENHNESEVFDIRTEIENGIELHEIKNIRTTMTGKNSGLSMEVYIEVCNGVPAVRIFSNDGGDCTLHVHRHNDATFVTFEDDDNVKIGTNKAWGNHRCMVIEDKYREFEIGERVYYKDPEEKLSGEYVVEYTHDPDFCIIKTESGITEIRVSYEELTKMNGE